VHGAAAATLAGNQFRTLPVVGRCQLELLRIAANQLLPVWLLALSRLAWLACRQPVQRGSG
jgi:hypothetical protein